jgi:hypothetical protein
VAYPAHNERSRPSGASPDEEFIIIGIGLAEREHLLKQDPDTFFVTPHYSTYPGVIVRLLTVNQDQLRELLVGAWRRVAPKRLVHEWTAKPPAK